MFEAPPRTYAELMIWKAFTETSKDEVWQYIFRWLKKYGNPFEDSTAITYKELEYRTIYQNAITYVIKN